MATQTASFGDDNNRAIQRHHSVAINKIQTEEKSVPIGNVDLVPEAAIGSRKEGDYIVRSTETHVIKVKDDPSQFRQRILQLVAGGGSGAITKTATAPLERVKILLQLQGMKVDVERPKYRGVLGTMKTVVREEGILSLYKGNGANVLRVIPVYALKFMFNDAFRDMVRKGDEPISFTGLVISGTLAGLFQTCVTYPLETVRTRLTLGIGLGVQYKGIVDVFRVTVKTEGVQGLYKGLGPTILTGSPYVGLQMSFYELFKRNGPKENKYSKVVCEVYKLCCGAAAGVIAQTVTYPGDTVRRRMQTNGMNGEARLYTTSWDCTLKIIRHEGVSALFNGLTANLIRALPGAAIQFWAYDLIKAGLGC